MTDLPDLKFKAEKGFPGPATVRRSAPGKSTGKLFPALKLKALVNFPADVQGRVGIEVTKQNGRFFLDLDYSDFGVIAPPDLTNYYVLTYNQLSKSYSLIAASSGGGGGLSDAPVDGSLYGRLNATWTKALPLAGGTLTGALILNANPAVPLGAATKQYVDAAVAGGGTFVDAPSDGFAYGRLNAAWAKVLPLAGGTMSGAITAAVKGHQFGTAAGVPGAVVGQADANILLYNFSATNWAGIGADNGGQIWFRTGLSGSVAPGFVFDASQIAHFSNSPVAPTPAPSDNSTKLATTAYVDAADATKQPLDSDLTALAANVGTGLWTVTGAGAGAARSIAVPAAGITITNPAGVAGNPTLALANDLAALEGLAATGIARRTAVDTWSVGTLVSNAELATMAAWTFKGNASGGVAAPTDVDIGALAAKATPAGSDEILLRDNAAAGAWKRTPISGLPAGGGGGAMVLLNTMTASNSALLTDTTSFTASYSVYEIVFTNLIAATATVQLLMVLRSGGVAQTTNYAMQGFLPNGTAIVSISSTTNIPLSNAGVVAAGAPGISGSVRVFNPSAAAIHAVTGLMNLLAAGIGYPWTIGGVWNSAAIVDGFQCGFSSGNITSGVIKVYGIQ